MTGTGYVSFSPLFYLFFVSFGACVGEGVGNHSVMCVFIDTYFLAATAVNFVADSFCFKPLLNSVFMTANDMAMADFVILPEFSPAGGTMYGQHLYGGF